MKKKKRTISEAEMKSTFSRIESAHKVGSSDDFFDGWWVAVQTAQTEASQIIFSIGTDDNNSQFWKNWNSGDPASFVVPNQYANVSDLYIHATSQPQDKNSNFWVGYKRCLIQLFEFDADEDHKMNQGNSQKCF